MGHRSPASAKSAMKGIRTNRGAFLIDKARELPRAMPIALVELVCSDSNPIGLPSPIGRPPRLLRMPCLQKAHSARPRSSNRRPGETVKSHS